MDRTTQAHIGKCIIYVFLLISSFLIILPLLGLGQWSVAREMLQVMGSTYSVLVGAVVGYYFRGEGNLEQNTVAQQKAGADA